MRIQQLITRMNRYALSAKILQQNPRQLLADVQKRVLNYLHEAPLLQRDARPVLLFVVMAFALLALLLSEAGRAPHYKYQVKKASFSEQPTPATEASLFDLPPDQFTLPKDHQALAREALLWLSVLGSYDDFSLTNEQLMTKFKNMNIAASILSVTADGRLRRQFWSERALTYGRYALGVLDGMIPNPDAGEAEEVKTRLLIAMALNYYEDGNIDETDIAAHFARISKTFLIGSGFCKNRILQRLQDDQIIELPKYLSLQNM